MRSRLIATGGAVRQLRRPRRRRRPAGRRPRPQRRPGSTRSACAYDPDGAVRNGGVPSVKRIPLHGAVRSRTATTGTARLLPGLRDIVEPVSEAPDERERPHCLATHQRIHSRRRRRTAAPHPGEPQGTLDLLTTTGLATISVGLWTVRVAVTATGRKFAAAALSGSRGSHLRHRLYPAIWRSRLPRAAGRLRHRGRPGHTARPCPTHPVRPKPHPNRRRRPPAVSPASRALRHRGLATTASAGHGLSGPVLTVSITVDDERLDDLQDDSAASPQTPSGRSHASAPHGPQRFPPGSSKSHTPTGRERRTPKRTPRARPRRSRHHQGATVRGDLRGPRLDAGLPATHTTSARERVVSHPRNRR